MTELPQRSPSSRWEPENKNIRYGHRAAINFKRIPHVDFFASEFTIPSISIDYMGVPTPFRAVPHAGTKINFDQSFNMTFTLDEDLQNYQEILDWMFAIGFPDNFDQYADLVQGKEEGDIFSDATAIIYTNNNVVLTEIHFTDAFPLNLDQLTFGVEQSEPLQVSAVFGYSKFDFKKDRHIA